MDPAIIISICAVLIATLSLGWQVYAWWHGRQAHVEVSASVALLGMPTGTVEAVSINATNRSEHPVRVAGVGLDLQDGSGRQMHKAQVAPGTTIPGTVPAHDSGWTYFLRDEVERAGISIVDPVTAWVRLSTGDVVKSRPRPLLRRD
jgi:hypothetical protein